MKNLTIIYIIALTIIALVIGISQYLVQKSIADSRYDARTINIAGRQSMLSQKIAKAALAMKSAGEIRDFNKAKAELREDAQLWETNHNALQYGNKDLELNNVNNSERTLLLFLELEPHYTNIRQAVSGLLAMDFTVNDSTASINPYVEKIGKSEDDYVKLMNEIILDYDKESSERIALLSRTEYVLLVIALALLLLEALFIFRPAINSIQKNTAELIQKEKSLEEALNEQKKERLKVEFLNKQARSIFDNVNQGLFLLDSKYTISELHSKALEGIFETSDLAGTNFIQLMRPRLVRRDIEALEMFIKHLFNPQIEESILKQLNPVENVKIYSDKMTEATIEPRHIKITFSRIEDGNKIYGVLVNVIDETENVVMQKKINDAEERNKKESAQLLSILKVDPLALSGYLDAAKIELKSISERYENDKSRDFRGLITYTFSTIHKLKGNASLIDLQLLVDKFHEMENTLIVLRDNPNLQGSDFLKVLYDINDTLLIVMNMQRMLSRIVEVNEKMATDKPKQLSNHHFINTLEKGLQKMADGSDKAVKLDFKDNGHIIPERFILPVKDVLVQLIRNSLVHGIEPSWQRKAIGKPETATISIAVHYSKSEGYSISYQDDGNGLDMEKISQKALENRLINKEDVSKLDNEGMALLIFNENFSTADQISEMAGRGQGMSLVKGIIEQYEGHFELDSSPGKYFKFQFSLPLVINATVLT